MTDDGEAYTVSKMLSSFNEVMAPVASDPSVSVSLQRKMENGVMLNTSDKEIAFLDMKAKVKHSAQRVARLDRQDKTKWVDEQRVQGKAAFERREYANAADLYVQALTALDFGDSPAEKAECQLNMQLPLTCNLAACMLMMEVSRTWRTMCAVRGLRRFVRQCGLCCCCCEFSNGRKLGRCAMKRSRSTQSTSRRCSSVREQIPNSPSLRKPGMLR